MLFIKRVVKPRLSSRGYKTYKEGRFVRIIGDQDRKDIYKIEKIKDNNLVLKDILNFKVDPKKQKLSLFKEAKINITKGDFLEFRDPHDGRRNREEVKVEEIKGDMAILKKTMRV